MSTKMFPPNQRRFPHAFLLAILCCAFVSAPGAVLLAQPPFPGLSGGVGQEAAGRDVAGELPTESQPDQRQVPPVELPPVPVIEGAAAQPATTQPSAGDPLVTIAELVEQRRTQVTAAESSLAVELRDTLKSVYQDTLTQITAASTAKAEGAKYKQMVASAIVATRQIQERVESLRQALKPKVDRVEDLREGKEQQQTLTTELSAATSELRRLEAELTRRTQRRQEIPVELAKVKTRQGELQKKPVETPELSDLAIEANRWYYTASLESAESQLRKLELESQAYDAESELLPLQIELARLTETRVKDQLQQVTSQLETLRSDTIKQSKYEAQLLLKNTDNADGRAQLEGLLQQIDSWEQLANEHITVQSSASQARETLDLWRSQLADMKARVDVTPDGNRNAQFNSWVGLMLRRQRAELPDSSQLKSDIDLVRGQLRKAESMKFALEDSLRDIRYELGKIDEALDDSIASTQLPAVLEKRQTVVRAMKAGVDDLIDDLLIAATTRQESIELVAEYEEFIDTHILWIRSAEPLAMTDLGDSWEAGNWLASRPNLQALWGLVRADVGGYPWWYLLFFASMAVLVFNRFSMSKLLGRLSQQAQKRGCSSFQLTARTLMLTVLIAAPPALLFLFAYWRLSGAAVTAFPVGSGEREYVLAIASAFLRIATVLFPVEFFRQVSKPHGLGVKHFEWATSTATTFTTTLPWLIGLGLPLVFLVATMSAQSDSRRENSLGRLAFIALMLLLCALFLRIASPSHGVISNHLKSQRGGWLDRTSWLWYSLICLAPVAIAITSAVGFYYTAHRIAIHLHFTIVMLVTLSIVFGLLARWLLLNRRKLMLSRARARLEEAARRDVHSPVPVSGSSGIDMVELNEQTRRMVTSLIVTTGLGLAYFIWSDVLPAIEILNGFVVWESKGATPQESTEVTLANIVLVIPVLVLMVIAGRNVPGLLEIGLLQHLPLSPAARYAVTTLFRYSIFALGIVIASSIVGLQWESIQWLVAALGVGLGFGLQEIFANFVSGVILLFEQPLRVGDIVSIDGTTGTVSKIRMRATTIINWDRQELIVPNKELITGKLLNWTLSDSTNRIMLHVGVAYGCDTNAACEIIRSICAEHPNVLVEPPPVITFEGFGDNALNIVVRAYLASLDHRLTTTHELHQQVYEAFGKAEIEIAFPQRDLHIRSLPDKLSRWLDAK